MQVGTAQTAHILHWFRSFKWL